MLMVDAKGSVITPVIARKMAFLIRQKFGDYDGECFWAEMHPSQAIQWEECGMAVQMVNNPTLNDANWIPKRTFLSFPLEQNAHLSPSVILIRRNREIVGEIGRLGLTNWKMEEVHA